MEIIIEYITNQYEKLGPFNYRNIQWKSKTNKSIENIRADIEEIILNKILTSSIEEMGDNLEEEGLIVLLKDHKSADEKTPLMLLIGYYDSSNNLIDLLYPKLKNKSKEEKSEELKSKIEILASKDALRIDEVDRVQINALHYICKSHNENIDLLKIAKILIDARVDIEQKGSNSPAGSPSTFEKTPLYFALRYDNYDIAIHLLNIGAEVNDKIRDLIQYKISEENSISQELLDLLKK